MKFFIEESPRNRFLQRLPFWLQMIIIIGLCIACVAAWYALVYCPLTTWREWYTQQSTRMQTMAQINTKSCQPDEAIVACKKQACVGAQERLAILFNSLKKINLQLIHCTRQQTQEKDGYTQEQYSLRIQGEYAAIVTWMDQFYQTVPLAKITTYQISAQAAGLVLDCTVAMLCTPTQSATAPLPTPMAQGEKNPFALQGQKQLNLASKPKGANTLKNTPKTLETEKPYNTNESQWKVIENTPKSMVLQDKQGNVREIKQN